MSRKFDLYRIVKIGMKALKRTNIPFYWSKHSRKAHTIHQHIMLIVLAQYIGNRSKKLRMIRYMDRIWKAVKLKEIPDESTISTEIRRIPKQWLRMVIEEEVKELGILGNFAVCG